MNASTIVSPALSDTLTEKPRISSIDILRGIVMVIMALDHTRDFFHLGAFAYDATNMQTTTPILFFTRFITHFCAPAFVFLAGTSIYISAQRKPKSELSVFLLTRGLWLIFLEVVIIRFSFFFNFYYDITFLQVIWVIGASMICMALLIHCSYYFMLSLGLLLIFGHNITDAILLKPEHSFYPIWAVLRQTGFFPITPDKAMIVMYPLLPWLGIMVVGYCLGKLYSRDYAAVKRQKVLFRIGMGALALFFILRLINVYGDPAPWGQQKNVMYTVMSFLNCTKYPVSLLYTLMTLGTVLIILSLMEKVNNKLLNPFAVFGRVPLFYYILHFYLIHLGALLCFMHKTGTSFTSLDFHFNKSFGGITPEGGYSLASVYLIWLILIIVLYPICKWYNRYKSTHTNWWLSYL